jgi:hypothetical protein
MFFSEKFIYKLTFLFQLYLYEFKKFQDLQLFMKRNLEFVSTYKFEGDVMVVIVW